MKKDFNHYVGRFIKAKIRSRPCKDEIINENEILFIKSALKNEVDFDGPDIIELVDSDVRVITIKNYHTSTYSREFSEYFEVLE